MINIKQLRDLVVRPALEIIGFNSIAAEQLVVGTAFVESNLMYLKQLRGPALGIYQMEPSTHDDIWENYLNYNAPLRLRVARMMMPEIDDCQQLAFNLLYATAMCRVHYLRVREDLPKAGDAMALAGYHKRHYNTSAGKANAEVNAPLFQRIIAELA